MCIRDSYLNWLYHETIAVKQFSELHWLDLSLTVIVEGELTFSCIKYYDYPDVSSLVRKFRELASACPLIRKYIKAYYLRVCKILYDDWLKVCVKFFSRHCKNVNSFQATFQVKYFLSFPLISHKIGFHTLIMLSLIHI